MNRLPQLRWSDVWLLVSLHYCSLKRQDLVRDVIAAADAINHAIMNYEEFSSALVRLEKHGLIAVQSSPWRITCTRKGREILDRAVKRNSLAFRIWQEVEKALGVEPWAPKEPIPHPENSLRYPGFTKGDYDAAVADYLRAMR